MDVIHTRLKGYIFFLAAISCLPLFSDAQMVLSNDWDQVATLSGTTVDLYGKSELHITGTGTPLTGCLIDMHDIDSWVFVHEVTPLEITQSSNLSQFRVNGSTLNPGNVKLVQYGQGTAIIPYASGFQPLEVFEGENFTGSSQKLSPNTSYDGAAVLNGKVSSFTLKRGYTATLSQNANGTGVSVNYVAADGDLKIGALPAGLNNHVYFIRVYPWHWVAKKGSCDIAPLQLNAKWYYNWNITGAAANRNYEYVGIKQQANWPSLDQNWGYMGINHLSGLNEPNNPVEDAYKSLVPVGDVGNAVERLPEQLGTGLRLGTPAVTDGGRQWILDFVNGARAAGYRLDYLPIHYYRNYWDNNDPVGAANNLKAYLKDIYDQTHLPIWLTEFNNGANWSNNNGDYDSVDPTFDQNRAAIEAMINMMDEAPWVERYSIYSAVEECRQVFDNTGAYTPMGLMYKDHRSPMAYQQILPGEGMNPSATYYFENNTDDSSGSGNHAVSHDYPDFVPGHNGGTAIQLDGENDHVILPDSLSDGTDFTFAAWVNWDGGAAWQRIFDFGIMDSSEYMFLTPMTDSSQGSTMRFTITTGGWGAEQRLTAATALLQNTWTHVAVTISGNTGRLYINGVEAVVNNSMTVDPEDLGAIQHYLGRSQFAADPHFKGMIDDVVIKGEALSGSQIAALYAGNQPPQVSADVIDGGSLYEGQAYSGSVSGNASDPDGGAVTYSKVYGPSWLIVASDGSLSGTPIGSNGDQIATIRATDSVGEAAYFQLNVTVEPTLIVVPVALVNGDFESGPAIYTGFDVPGSDVPGWTDAGAIVDSGVDGPSPWFGARGSYAAFMKGGDGGIRQLTDCTIQAGDQFTVGFWAASWDGTWSSGPLGTVTATLFYDDGGTDVELGSYTTPTLNQYPGFTQYSNTTVIAATPGAVGKLLGVRLENTAVSSAYATLDDISLIRYESLDTIPPDAPTGLDATAGNASVDLSWADNIEPDLGGYSVYRSTTSGGNYTSVASGLNTNVYTDNGLTNGIVYYYALTATDMNANESVYSSEISAIPSPDVVSEEFYISDHSMAGNTNLSLVVSNSVMGHQYALQATDTLIPTAWSNIMVKAGTSSNLLFGVPIDPSSANRFFKLDVHR